MAVGICPLTKKGTPMACLKCAWKVDGECAVITVAKKRKGA